MAPDGFIGGIILPLGCFFLESWWAPSKAYLCPGVPIAQGLCMVLVGEAHALLSPTTSTVFRRKCSFSFRSQLSKKFMSGIRNF